MEITTEKIIHILPFESEFKKQLLESLGTLDSLRKFQIVKILWDTYYEMYDGMLDEELEGAFERAGEDKEKLDGEFFQRAVGRTQNSLGKVMIQSSEQVDLSATRQKLEEIMQSKQ